MSIRYPSIIAALTLWTLPAHGPPAVLLSIAAERVAAEYPAGQVLSAPLFVASGCDAGVFGVELTVLGGSDDFVVRSVTSYPAFSQELGEVSPAVANAPGGAPAAAARCNESRLLHRTPDSIP